MNTDFLESILRDPDDDAPRLVWADALEEQGDLRGEYLRLEVKWRRERRPEPDDATAWECVLLKTGPNKIGCIKAIREITAFGLKAAKDVADLAPAHVQRVSLQEAVAQRAWLSTVDGVKATIRRTRTESGVGERLWLQLLELTERLKGTHAEWLRAVNRTHALWVPQPPSEETVNKLNQALPMSYAAGMLLGIAWRMPANGPVTLREGLERNAAARALSLFEPEEKPELRRSKCFFDWPAGS
ncbi:MAG: ribosomal protein L7/L12 [Archangium sp.]